MIRRHSTSLFKTGLIAFTALACASIRAEAADNGVAQTPLMGWSSWSTSGKRIDEKKVKAEADAMAAKLESFGYTYINIDAGWDRGYDENGRRKPDPQKFPSGMAALANYVHGKGLKLGIYLVPGIDKDLLDANPTILGTTQTIRDIVDTSKTGNTIGRGNCAIDFSKPGASEYIQSCVDLLASWGIDYIKMDFVGPGGGRVPADDREEIKQWMAAIKKSSHPIWLELSNSLKFEDVDVWKANSNGWRIEGDIEDYHSASHSLTSWAKASKRFTDAIKWQGQSGPGGWNDMDSTEVGAGNKDGLTMNERYSVFTLWSMCCAPIILGPDLTTLDSTDLPIITNPEVIAIQQGGHPAKLVSKEGEHQVWKVQNPDGSCYVALFNLGGSSAQVTASWNQLGLSGPVSARDLWSRSDMGTIDSELSAQLDAHACKLVKLTPSH
ncbi:MAG TPA: glycoside hydrolase family 27 protein [Candidatus Methylacidiphilales bacterium]|nr:glycoside hydrolase family 27 protein [Candidatus Methylacidiphilales bacterium]